MNYSIFVTGTDTGIGKTIVTAAVALTMRKQDYNVGVMKPIETGVRSPEIARSDAARLRFAAGSHDSLAEIRPYSFRLPLAPIDAAQHEKRKIKLSTIMRALRTLQSRHDILLVEGVGGVHVPITSSLNASDLIYRMMLPAIVVGQSGLGGINHALLTLQVLRRQKIPIVALVLNQQRPLHTKTARVQEQSTVSLLRRLAGVPVVGPLPYSRSVTQNWNEGVVGLAGTAPITKLVRLVLARIIHDDSSRKRADAKRDW